MENTASFSKNILSGNRQELIESEHRPAPIPDNAKQRLSAIRRQIIELKLGQGPTERELLFGRRDHPWTESHLSVLLEYVAKLEGIYYPDFSVSDYLFEPRDSSSRPQIIESLAQDILFLFKMPNIHYSSNKYKSLEKNELVAAFITFLLALTSHSKDSIWAFRQEFNDLRKELRYLVTILGDVLFSHTEVRFYQDLMAEFEEVADRAGTLLHSFVFTRDPLAEFKTKKNCKALNSLLSRIDLLRVKIVKFSSQKRILMEAGMTPKASSVNSLYTVDSLIYDLEDLLNRDDSLIVDVKGQISKLHRDLMVSQFLLKSMMEPPLSEIQEFQELVLQFREGAYEAEYSINHFLVGDAPLWYVSVRLSHILYKINLIRAALAKIKKDYDVRDSIVAKSSSVLSQAKRNSEVNDVIVGFEDNVIDILDQLVGGTERLQSISIYGMPGLGKTTFAKKLYDHPLVNYRFDARSWCVVSQSYQRKGLLIDLLMNSTSELDKAGILNMREEGLAQRIYKSLKGKRYLIVLDDIWSSNVWNDLLRCFPDDGNGSRILFTSRHKDTALPHSMIYALPSLSNYRCWELLEKKVFHNEPCPPKLLRIGKKIAANCDGLPLAVVAIAGILSAIEIEESAWKGVGENLVSYILKERNNPTMQILELSYKHLPEHLKPCFLYFGAFQGYKEVTARKLMRLWVAEGFIRKEQGKDAETVAEDYLTELINKSLVMVSKRRSSGGVKSCIIHDLWRDFCSRIAEKENFLKLINNYSIYEKHQRLCIHFSGGPTSTEYLPPVSLHVRSFIGSRYHPLNMKVVRVLDLGNKWLINYDTDAIKFLIHLRYLVIGRMPRSISSLVNLEYLVLVGLLEEVDLSLLIPKMQKLRYLHVSPGARYDIRCSTSQTNNLECLSTVVIHELKDMEMLKCSPHLRNLKCSFKAIWVKEEEGYTYPDFSFLPQLKSLSLATAYGQRVAGISLPLNIKKLTLSKLRLPWEKMSTIGGLPNLQVLKLLKSAFVGDIWETRDGEFQQLRFLKLEWLVMTEWNVASSQHFPKLQQLVCRVCIFLQEIPGAMAEITTLQSIEVVSCSKAVAESALLIQQEQQDMGNEELRVIIR